MKLATLSTPALVAATIYAALAVYVVYSERTSSGGGWISLSGMATYLITLPVSLTGEWLGMKPDFRRNLDMFVTIALCAGLVYLVVTGIVLGGRALFSSGNRA